MADSKLSVTKNPAGEPGPSAEKKMAQKTADEIEKSTSEAAGPSDGALASVATQPGEPGQSAEKNLVGKSAEKQEDSASGAAGPSDAAPQSEEAGPSAEKKSTGEPEISETGAAGISKETAPKPEPSKPNESKLGDQKANPKKARGVPEALYDENGIHIETGLDLCDCMKEDCPGCFPPCRECGSHKCDLECRRNREFSFEPMENLMGTLIINPFLFRRF